MSDTPDLPDFGQLFSQASPGGGPVNWEVARQVAMAFAPAGRPDPEPTADDRSSWDGIVRAADLALERAGVPSRGAELLTVAVPTRAGYASETLDSLRPLLEKLATRLGAVSAGAGFAPMIGLDPSAAAGEGENEGGGSETQMASAMAQAMAEMMKPLAPLLMGFQMGMVLGFVASRALSTHDLCLPRAKRGVAAFLSTNVDQAATEAGVARDDLRMWVALREVALQSELHIDWVRRRLESLLTAYVESIQFDASELQSRMGQLDLADPESLQQLADNADGLLGNLMRTTQPDVLESLQTFMSVLDGYADHVAGVAAAGLLRAPGTLLEALHHRHAEAGEADRLLESLLGLQLTPELIERGRDFCVAVTARSRLSTLNRMWETLETFPTKEELAQPEGWLARMEATPIGGLFRELDE